MLNYIAHICPDILATLSYAATNNSNLTKEDFKELLEVEYLWQTKEKGQYYTCCKTKTHHFNLYVMLMHHI
jgi:hypothetical protein